MARRKYNYSLEYRSCRRKKRFRDFSEATDILRHWRKKLPEKYSGYHAYECGYCRGWHIGADDGRSSS